MAGHAFPSPINAAAAISPPPIARAIPDRDTLCFLFFSALHPSPFANFLQKTKIKRKIISQKHQNKRQKTTGIASATIPA